MIDKTQVAVIPGIATDARGNYNTLCKMPEAELPRLVEECWHLRQDYHCDDLFRVPIPVTYNAKVVFFTGIVPYSNNIYVSTFFEVSPVDRERLMLVTAGKVEQPLIPAKFAELIVAKREWLLREGRASPETPYVIINYRALLDKDVPQMPMEIVKRMKGRNPSCYHYSTDDLLDSMTYWAHHCLINTR